MNKENMQLLTKTRYIIVCDMFHGGCTCVILDDLIG